LFLLTAIITSWGQRKIDIPKENESVRNEIEALQTQLKLNDIKFTSDLNCRIWFFNDLVISMNKDNGQETIVVTCYYEKQKDPGNKIVSEYKNYVIPKDLVATIWTQIQKLNLKEWKNDFEVEDYPLKHTFGYINAYEYADNESYRLIKYYTPALAKNTMEGVRAFELKEFLETELSLNKYRLDFLETLKQPDRNSKKMLRLIKSL
jgi:hypothetical protein